MYFSPRYILLASLASTSAHAIIVAQSIDGSFVPWSFGRRAPGDGLPLRLVNHNDMSYLTTVYMGTPFQAVEMAPSLSQDFIAVATPPLGVSSNTYYNPSLSTSYTPPSNAIATIQSISGGNITGRFGGETCRLMALTSATWKYNASIALTNSSVGDALYPLGARGVLGYGVNAPAGSPPNSSLIPTFLPANFTSAVCGIEINHMDDPVPDGIFTMGAVDPSAYTGNFTNMQVPPTTQVSWSVSFDTLSYGSGGTAQTMPGLLASVDIYHNVIQVPTDMATQIYASIPGSEVVSNGMWSVPCTASFPVTLTFGGKPFTISERDTITKLPNGTCRGAVTGGAQLIAKVGSPFLRNVYTQFGAQKASNGSTSFFVGFAAKRLRTRTTVVTTTVLSATTVTTAVPTSTPTSAPTSAASWIYSLQDSLLFSTFAVASIVALIL